MRAGLKWLTGAAAPLLLALWPAGGMAQSPASPLCRAVEGPLDGSAVKSLTVACGQAGLSLGQVDAFELIQLPALRAAVVVTSFDRARRVWLVTIEGDRELGLEELTGTIARAAGRGTSMRLDGLEFDVGPGATGRLTASVMSVRNRTDGGGASSEIDLAAMVSRMRSIRSAAGGGH